LGKFVQAAVLNAMKEIRVLALHLRNSSSKMFNSVLIYHVCFFIQWKTKVEHQNSMHRLSYSEGKNDTFSYIMILY